MILLILGSILRKVMTFHKYFSEKKSQTLWMTNKIESEIDCHFLSCNQDTQKGSPYSPNSVCSVMIEHCNLSQKKLEKNLIPFFLNVQVEKKKDMVETLTNIKTAY